MYVKRETNSINFITLIVDVNGLNIRENLVLFSKTFKRILRFMYDLNIIRSKYDSLFQLSSKVKSVVGTEKLVEIRVSYMTVRKTDSIRVNIMRKLSVLAILSHFYLS